METYRLTCYGLLIAFIELAFAYCLLCISTCIFVTSKLLFFLPCSCSQNIQKLLFDYPIKIILKVQKLATTIKSSLSHHQEQEGEDKDLVEKVRLLGETIEKERVARSALMVELEEERAASRSAADAAMAMILKLQGEKALFEMEVKQYERMIEEKFAYDEEEMNVLKEILFKREREKHFLEKELEAYHNHIDDDVDDDQDGRFNLVEDREPIMYDVHVIEDKSNAKVKDDDLVEHTEIVKDHDSDSSPTSSSISL